MPHTLAEKILLSHCDADDVEPGDVVMARCDVVMANDVSGPVAFRQLEKMGAKEVFDPAKIVMVADHFMPAKDARSAQLQRALKEWADAHGVAFYDQGRGGIEHALLCEEGWVWPGAILAGGDSHTCTYGALGAFGTGLGSTDIAACLAFGEFWQTVPAHDPRGLHRRKTPVRHRQGPDSRGASSRSASAGGRTPRSSSSARARRRSRSTSASRSPTWPSRPARRRACSPLTRRPRRLPRGPRATGPWSAERSDPDAEFARELRIDLAELPPLIALPHLPGNVAAVSEVAGTKIDQVYIGNCSNGTMTDLRQTAEILRGHTVHRDCRMIVVPATQRIYREALAEGLLDLFVEAGAMVSTPTCGACFGGGMGVLGAGERAIATTNRNFRGRMGSRRRRGAPGQRVRGRRRRGGRRDRRSRGARRGRVIIEGRARGDRRATTSTPT